MKNVLLILVAIMLFGCDEAPKITATEPVADSIYLNGEIITMVGDKP